MNVYVIVVAALFGLIIGSFLNVIIVRLAHLDWRDRYSIGGRSECPQCKTTIAWYDNVPVISWFILRGVCRSCKTPISLQYPLVELTTSLLWAVIAASAVYRNQSLAELITGLIFVSILVPISVIDLRLRIIPDELNFTAIFLGFALSLGLGPQDRFLATDRWWLEVLGASAAAALFLKLPEIATRGRGMGRGDIKLAIALGAFLGAPVAIGMFAGFVAAIVPSIVLIVSRGFTRGRKSTIAFGPFLAFGGLVGWLAGEPLLNAYLSSFA